MSSDREDVKKLIIERFEKHVKGRVPNLVGYNHNHDGAEGDWLTKEMGLTVNGKNEPDFLGFEMKKDSRKTTFGDWAPDVSLYKAPQRGQAAKLHRSEFLKIFGTPKVHHEERKNGRFSWSGEVFPTVKGYNRFGQIMVVEKSGDINANYSYSKDLRSDKTNVVPKEFQTEDLNLAKWSGDKLRVRLERKFNQLGWFKCLKDSQGRYSALQFGHPINYEKFLQMVSSGDVFCDCGMYDGNPRPYMTWRANHHIWDQLQE